MPAHQALKPTLDGSTAGQTVDSKTAREASRSVSSDVLIYATLATLVFAAWSFSRLGLFKAGDDVGYWLGVAGGVMMLLLFTYPLRKYVKFMRNWGKVKWWFLVHMTLGIGGPLLILMHSTFHVGSLNAGVALYSMIIVAVSGIIGRFVYQQIHRGLHGERLSLHQLQTRAGFVQNEAQSKLQFAPKVEARLRAFEQQQIQTAPGWATVSRQLLVLPVQQWMTYTACVADLRQPLQSIAEHREWTREEHARRVRLSKKLVRRYLGSVVKVAQFTAYERLFALWHMAHVPFVYILIISAVAHVVAVHAY